MRLRFPLLPNSVRWLGVLAVASVLVYFSLLAAPPPGPPGGRFTPGTFWDKKLHFAGYAALALSLAYATAATPFDRWRRSMFVVAAAILFGVAIELLQAPLPDRYFSTLDILANAFGASIGSVWFLAETRLEYVPFDD